MIFLTGVTGFLGRELLRRLLTTCPEDRFAVLIRDRSQADAEARFNGILCDTLTPGRANFNEISQQRARIEVVCGDLCQENFGLGQGTFNDLAKNLRQIFHSAASTHLQLPLEEARAINVAGTKHVLDLAQVAKNQQANDPLLNDQRALRFNHISTAYVAGTSQAIVLPNELRFHGFRNSYEQTKAEAEALVRGAQSWGLASTIFRPSVIVGDSNTGKTTAFNVIYLPAKLLIKGICKALPALPHTPFDVVPVDYVANAIAILSQQPSAIGQSFHITAGLGRESSPLEVLNSFLAAVDQYRNSRPSHLCKPLFVTEELILRAFSSSLNAAAQHMRLLEKMVTEHIGVFSQLLPFVPYMLSNPRFDNHQTLAATGVSLGPAPLFSQYANAIFTYCLKTNWGRSVGALTPA